MQPSSNRFGLNTDVITQESATSLPPLAQSFDLGLSGWKKLPSKAVGAGFEADIQLERDPAGLENIIMKPMLTHLPGPGEEGYPNDAEISTALIEQLIASRAASFVQQGTPIPQPNVFIKTSSGAQLEFLSSELTSQNAEGQKMKFRVAARSTRSYQLFVFYSDLESAWDPAVWDKILQTLVLPGTFVPFTSQQPTSPTISQPQAVVATPQPTPVAPQPAGPVPTTTSAAGLQDGDARRRLAIAAVIVVLLLIGGGLALHSRNSGDNANISPEQAQKLADNTAGEINSSSKQYKIGQPIDTGDYTYTVDRIVRNGQGEQTKMDPGETEEYVQIYLTFKNLTKKTATISAINFEATADGEYAYFYPMTEPDSLNNEGQYTLRPGESFTKSLTLEATAGVKTALLGHYSGDKVDSVVLLF
jgi:hypothetical protein